MPTVFIDTNILLYCIDLRYPAKRQCCIDLVTEHGENAVVSVQVLQEFYWNATRKLGMSPATARKVVELWSGRRVVEPSAAMVLRAIDTSERYTISFWDATIVEAAVAADCSVLISEDLSDKQSIRGVTVRNPF